ncbi:heavy metal-binding domain-containing protein [Luteolibacter marinus]|uniref:heavy metal-binding domain-containing protein n=1 Tax=Luteolibacter marinus TaxID=2776705 RepID=UPI0018696DAF
MLVTTTEQVAGRPITATLGAVTGSVVWSKHIGRDIMAGFKTLVGGEIRGYTEMLVEARGVATGRMVEQAQSIGADAVVCTRFATSAVMQGMSEVIAFGTAVKLG